eukprot:GHVH01007385.1.p1 GENE.GHVH01007385.1~~GHVH01007385.1.p1  ORF type:complete len:148 (+),score=14.90 GHVH01007385.1:301-744(+)
MLGGAMQMTGHGPLVVMMALVCPITVPRHNVCLEETSHCMWDKISEVSRSASNSLGYEIAIGYQPGTVEFDDCMASTIESDSYNLKNKTASELLDIWVNSDYHRSVIDNENEWADFYWTRIGVSVGKCVASAWFTTERSDPICFTSL